MVVSATPLATPHSPLAATQGVMPATVPVSPATIRSDRSSDGPPCDTLNDNPSTDLTPEQRMELTERLLEAHYDRVYRYAFHLQGCRNTAEDVAQEVFVRAYSKAHQLRSQEAAVGWLLTITRNEVARTCFKAPAGLPSELEAEEWTSLETQLEDQEWVHAALLQLSTEFRTVVLMFYFEQKSYTDIATELGLPIGTVMSRLNRARGQLKQQLIALSQPTSRRFHRTTVSKEASR